MDWPFLFLATHALKNYVEPELIQLFRASQQLKSICYSLTQCDIFWTPGLHFCFPPEITLLSLQSRGTGGYGSTLAVPLKPPFFLSASVKCLVMSDCHDKRFHFFSCFFPICLIGFFVCSWCFSTQRTKLCPFVVFWVDSPDKSSWPGQTWLNPRTMFHLPMNIPSSARTPPSHQWTEPFLSSRLLT